VADAAVRAVAKAAAEDVVVRAVVKAEARVVAVADVKVDRAVLPRFTGQMFLRMPMTS
jgi:hypothetical protein